MARIPFKLRSGNSPVKQGGLILKGLKYVANKLLSKKGVATGLGLGATEQALSDKTKNRSTTEKVLRAVDEWGPTMGAISHGYDQVKSGKAKIPKGYYQKGGEGYQKRDYS